MDDEGLSRGILEIDGEQEHWGIRNQAWADYWAVDTHSSIHGELVKTKLQPEEEKKLYKKYNKVFEKNIDQWE